MEICYDAFLHNNRDTPPPDENMVVDNQNGITLIEIIKQAKDDRIMHQYLIMEYNRLYEELSVITRESREECNSRKKEDTKKVKIREFTNFCYGQSDNNQRGFKYPDIGVEDIYCTCIDIICSIHEKLVYLRYQLHIIERFIDDIEHNPIKCMFLMRRFGGSIYLAT